MGVRSAGRVCIGAILAMVVVAGGCQGVGRRSSGAEPVAIRLVDRFESGAVQGAPPSARQLPRTEFAAADWKVGADVTGLSVRDGRLVGRSTGDFPVIYVTRSSGFDTPDLVHALEVRMKVSAGSKVAAQAARADRLDVAQQQQVGRGLGWGLTGSLTPGDAVQTYTLTPLLHTVGTTTQHILLRPTDVAGATFEIESVRLIFRREHLASIPSGVAWQGLREIYRESLAARAPERIDLAVDLPEEPWLDLAVGTLEEAPITFSVAVSDGSGTPEPLLEHTVTTPHRWEPQAIDLRRWAGRRVTVSLALAAEEAGTLGFWGAPVVRNRLPDAASSRDAARPAPRGVILIQADTLRRDHLDAYGYARPTAPAIGRLATQGAKFQNYVVQATWTKVSTPSLMTSLYPLSHGVIDFSDHLPAAANTLAESYRAAGYATISLASVMFTGQFTNLHQGFEELHEDGSFSERESSKTAREYVDRLAEWLTRHRDTPFFAFLHVFDPHDPFEPRRPYDALWTDPTHKDEHVRQLGEVRKVIKEPLLRMFGMPSRDELVAAGLDADAFVEHDRGWYDGSIRGMDAEVARLMQTLRRLGLADDTLVVFLSDHGEEFLEHGRMFHGQSVYGELVRVPLVLHWPAGIPAGQVIEEVVESIDVMPSLLEMSGIDAPDGMQGRSFASLVGSAGAGGTPPAWRRRPAIAQKAITSPAKGGAPPPHETESFAIMDGQWKLVRHTARPRGGPEFELYDFVKDPLDTTDVAAQHPDVVARLAKALDGWKQMAESARLKPDAETTKNLSPEQLQRLRSLGYVR